MRWPRKAKKVAKTAYRAALILVAAARHKAHTGKEPEPRAFSRAWDKWARRGGPGVLVVTNVETGERINFHFATRRFR